MARKPPQALIEVQYRSSSAQDGVQSRGAGWHPPARGLFPQERAQEGFDKLATPELADGDLVRQRRLRGRAVERFYVASGGHLRQLLSEHASAVREVLHPLLVAQTEIGAGADLTQAWTRAEEPGALASAMGGTGVGARCALQMACDASLAVAHRLGREGQELGRFVAAIQRRLRFPEGGTHASISLARLCEVYPGAWEGFAGRLTPPLVEGVDDVEGGTGDGVRARIACEVASNLLTRLTSPGRGLRGEARGRVGQSLAHVVRCRATASDFCLAILAGPAYEGSPWRW